MSCRPGLGGHTRRSGSCPGSSSTDNLTSSGQSPGRVVLVPVGTSRRRQSFDNLAANGNVVVGTRFRDDDEDDDDGEAAMMQLARYRSVT